MAPPVIHIKDIPPEGLRVQCALDAAWLRTALDETEMLPVGDPAGRADVALALAEDDVVLTGTVAARLRMPCVRCLEPVELEVSAEFRLHLEPAERPRERAGRQAEVDLRAEELDADVYENERVELGHWLREQLLLEAPAFPSCPGGCAAPLGPTHTADSTGSIDPRLAPLKSLSKKE